MPEALLSSAAPKRGKPLRLRIFGNRLQVGLAAVALAGLIVRPRNLFGEWELLGDALCIALIVFGLALRAWASGSAGDHTRRATIEAPRLATGGPFAYVRNPIYLASIILGLGMVGLLGDPWMFALYVAVFVFLYSAIVPAEEAFLRKQFRDEYERYCAAVPRLVPRLSRWSGARPAAFSRQAVIGEVWLALGLGGIYLFLQASAALRRIWLP